MSESQPLISVVLSVYNGERYLRQSIESILNQSFTDFEFIIIDDGSTDSSKKIITSYDDSRIRFISHENRGLVAALNEGIGVARGRYIARQDDDDVSLRHRFKTQVALLESNKELVVVGSSIIVINEQGERTAEHRILLEDRELRDELLIRSPFAHGSIMVKTEAIKRAGLYREEYWPAEDYDLWVRIAAQGKLANVDEPLYKYRVNNEGISIQNAKQQAAKKLLIKDDAAQAIGFEPLTRDVLKSMLKRYTMLPTFFYRRRVQLLLNNYLQLSARKSIFTAITYCIHVVTCPRFYVYGLKVVRSRL